MDTNDPPVFPTSLHLDRRAAELATRATAAGNSDEWLTTAQLADMLAVSKQWAELRRKRGDGPPFFRPSPNAVRYRRGEVVEWLYQRHHWRTSEYEHEPSARDRPRGRQKGSKVVDGRVIPPATSEPASKTPPAPTTSEPLSAPGVAATLAKRPRSGAAR